MSAVRTLISLTNKPALFLHYLRIFMNAVNGDLQYALSNLYLLGLLEKVKSYGNKWGTVFGILIFIDLHIELVNPGREVVCGKRRTLWKWWCGKYRFDLLCPVYTEELEVNCSCSLQT